MRWLADKLDTGERLQRPATLYSGLPPLSFFTDAKAESERAWIGGFLDWRYAKGSGVPGSPWRWIGPGLLGPSPRAIPRK